MKTRLCSFVINAPYQDVFQYLSDSSHNGLHLVASSSVFPMGSRLAPNNYLHKTESGATIRWRGKILGMRIDFKEIITKYTENKEREWETLPESKMQIFEWYKMKISVLPSENGSYVEIGMKYKRSSGMINSLLSLLFADLYARWCIKKMRTDLQHFFSEKQHLDLKAQVTS